MAITAVVPSLVSSNSKFRKQENGINVTSSNINNSNSTNNLLMDLNYGKSLVKSRNVSFGRLPGEVSTTLTRQASIVVDTLTSEDILLLGRDLKEAVKALKDSALMAKNVLKKVFFLKGEDLEGPIAIQPTQFPSLRQIINLGESPVVLNKGNASRTLRKGDSFFLGELDSVNQGEVCFTIDPSTQGRMGDIPDEVFKQFDLSSEQTAADVARINAKTLEKLIGEEKKVGNAHKVTLADIGGQDEAIAAIRKKVLNPIKYPNFYAKNRMDGARSVLFVGDPGNGKTLTAKALANEAGITFYDLNPQLLEGQHVGESAAKIHEYFENARKTQPCIIFMDEIDAVLGKRTGNHKYADQSVNMYLDEMSKLDGEQVCTIGATNHPELMDEAALRNGRFGNRIEFKNPDTAVKCKTILNIHAKSLNVEGLDVDAFSEEMRKANLSGADIAALVEEAKMNAIGRQGIFEQMDQGTFVDDPNFKLIISGEDFNKALSQLMSQRELVQGYVKKEKVMGFKPEG